MKGQHLFLHTSTAVTGNGNSREFPEMSQYTDLVMYIQVTAFTATSIDFVLRAYNPRHINDGTNTPQFNIINEFEWIDGTGTAIALTASGGQNVLRFSGTGKARGRLKNGYRSVPDTRIDLQWIYTGGGSVTFDALAVTTQ